MTPTRRNELIRIATKGLSIHELKLSNYIRIISMLENWEDAPEVKKQYEIKQQQLNLLR